MDEQTKLISKEELSNKQISKELDVQVETMKEILERQKNESLKQIILGIYSQIQDFALDH